MELLMEIYPIESVMMKYMDEESLVNLKVDFSDNVEREIFRRFKKTRSQDLVVKFPEILLEKFGIENLDLDHLWKLDDPEEEIFSRFERGNLTEKIEIISLDPEYFSEMLGLEFLKEVLPKASYEDVFEFLENSEDGYESEFEFSSETEEELFAYGRIKQLSRKFYAIWKFIPEEVAWNRQFLKDFEFWEWVSGIKFYKGTIYFED